MAKTTSGQLIKYPLQYVEESTEGTTPTASPTFITAGFVESLSIKINGNFIDISQLATEDLLAIIQGNQVYEWQVKLHITSSTYIKYALNAQNVASPAGTISATLSHMFSIYLNGTENFILLKGCRANSITISTEIGKAIDVTIEWVSKTIIQAITTANAGLTTPTFVSVTATGAVWSWITGTTAPATWNGSGIDAVKISITVNRNTKSDHTLGNLDPHSSQSHGRRASGDITVLWTTSTGSAMETDFRAGTSRTMTWILKDAVSTITLTGTVLVDRAVDLGADDTEATVEQWAFRCPSITAS